MSDYQTLNAVIKTGMVPAALLKRMVHEGRCPGIYTGTRFYVNVPMLEEQLQRESEKTTRQHKNK